MKSFSWVLIGNLFYALSQWLILVLITKLGTIEDLGLFTLAMAIVAPVVLFFNFQLRNIQASDVNSEFKLHDYLGFRVFFNTIVIIIFLIIFLVMKDADFSSLILIVVFIKVTESYIDLMYGYYIQRGKSVNMGKSLVFRAFLSFILFTLTYILTMNILYAAFSIFISWLVILVYFDMRRVKKIEKKFRIEYEKIGEIVKKAYLLAFSALAISLIPNIPKYSLAIYLSEIEVGIYTAISYVVIAGNIIINSLFTILIPIYSKMILQENIKKIKFLTKKVSFIIFFIWIIFLIPVFFLGDRILAILYNAEFSLYSNELLVLFISFLFLAFSELLMTIIMAEKNYSFHSLINLLTLFTITLLTIILVPELGILGACISVLVANSTKFFMCLFKFHKITK